MTKDLIRAESLTMHFPLHKGLLANLFARQRHSCVPWTG